jgi:ATP-dependent Clp protease ATP-binding subunit ClpA
MIDEVNVQLKEKDMRLQLLPEAKEWLIQKGFDPSYGARPLRRVVQRYIEDTLAEEVLKGRFTEHGLINVIIKDDKPAFIEQALLASSQNGEGMLEVLSH